MNPLTGIYRVASTLRNSLFDRGVLAIRRLERPVVSVGNLSVGGAGKTPFVIALGELLKTRGVRFDVLSRGYGRKTRGVLVVEPDGCVADFGDEPLLIARRLNVPVVVGESRYEAGRVAETKFASQVHILDDGFQHRSLARDFDIVLATKRDFEDRLLPLGRLRELPASLARADAVVLPAESSANHPALRGKPVWRVKREIAIPAAPEAPVVFCGIARPEQFFAQVRAAGIQPAAEIAFRDHHAYDLRDVEQLLAKLAKQRAGGFVTTEKDAINMGALLTKLTSLAIATLTLTLDNPADMVDTILGTIRV
ncbi:MAG: tetraacyldisaccharide 4'-kinase [Terriglobales bacterium]